ncbi:MAG: lipopolysaccharide heptosyltransferase II, partial [Deltaproteobacteria bacterium]
MTTYKKILVVQTAFPGDIVLTTPLFKALKKRFPESKLTLLTTPSGDELLRDIKEIDSLITYDKKGKDRGMSGFAGLVGQLRDGRFDICFSPHRSYRTALLLYGAGIPVRVGFSGASLSFLYSRKIYRDPSRHEVERVLSLLEPFVTDISKADKAPYLELSPDVWKKVKELFDEAGISSNDTVIAIAPGSVWATKRWTAEGYAALIDRLAERYDSRIVLIGSMSERGTGDEILAIAKYRAIDLIGKTTLRELIAVIDRCQLLIGNDSAPGHIASARMVPVVSIFGPTVPAFGYYPYGKDVVIVEKKLPCRPCHHHGPGRCPKGHFRC